MKTKAYYLSLDYEIVLRKLTEEEGGGYFAYYKDFPGVMGGGEWVKSELVRFRLF